MTSGVAAQSARPTRAVRSRAAPFGLKGNAGSPRALRHSFVSTGAVSRNGFGLRKQQAVSAQRQDGRSLRVVNVSQIRDFNLNVEKEEGRLYYRLQYGKADWIKHRARNRYVRHLQTLLFSQTLRNIAAPMYMVTFASCIALCIHNFSQFIPQTILAMFMYQTALPVTVTASMLALLLVFRTNNSFARWRDARGAWGIFTTKSRNLVRQVCGWLPDGEVKDKCVNYMIAFGYALNQRLREEPLEVHHIDKFLTPEEVEKVRSAYHQPLYCLQCITALVRSQQIHPQLETEIDGNMTHIEEFVGLCENMLRNPIPLSYTRHTSRAMLLWLIFLPFALVSSCQFAVIPVCLFVSFVVLGIEEVGVNIEEPYTILPLELVCNEIEKSSYDILKNSSIANALYNPETKLAYVTSMSKNDYVFN
eukprot:scaffold7262_cov538-Prasinococcus_capsulatus_cf.AAC.3